MKTTPPRRPMRMESSMLVACARCETDYRDDICADGCPCCGCKEKHFICEKHKVVYHIPAFPNVYYAQCPLCEQDELEKAKQS